MLIRLGYVRELGYRLGRNLEIESLVLLDHLLKGFVLLLNDLGRHLQSAHGGQQTLKQLALRDLVVGVLKEVQEVVVYPLVDVLGGETGRGLSLDFLQLLDRLFQFRIRLVELL